jgi:maltose alpha-D-glucosyltransferase/alpha-amylase
VELDLSRFAGSTPVELFGSTPLPRITRQPYLLTLGPHSFYWFAIQPHEEEVAGAAPAVQKPLLEIAAPEDWTQLFTQYPQRIEAVLPSYMQHSRWYESHPHTIKSARIREYFRLTAVEPHTFLLAVDVEFHTADTSSYILPLTLATDQKASDLQQFSRGEVLCRLQGTEERVLYDSLLEPEFCTALVDFIDSPRRVRGSQGGELLTAKLAAFGELRRCDPAAMNSAIVSMPHTTAVTCDGGRFILKPLHRLEEGTHPAWDIGLLLSQRQHFPQVATLAGSISYRRRGAEPAAIAVLHGFVPNEGNAWQFTLDSLGHFLERVAAYASSGQEPPPVVWPTDWSQTEVPDTVKDLIGDYLESVRLLGQRTAELHLALAAETDDPDFAPEGFSSLFQRSTYQTLRSLKMDVFDALRRQKHKLPPAVQEKAQDVLNFDVEIMRRFRLLVDRRIEAVRIRFHGDFHLGQVLHTGKDFVFVDFEGGPRASLAERRTKRSPLRDVASMLLSFHYAVQTALLGPGQARAPQAVVREEDLTRLQPWAHFWGAWVKAVYLKGYDDTAGDAPFVPTDPVEMKILFDAFIIERALRELVYELQHRPAWTDIPLTCILEALQATEPTAP